MTLTAADLRAGPLRAADTAARDVGPLSGVASAGPPRVVRGARRRALAPPGGARLQPFSRRRRANPCRAPALTRPDTPRHTHAHQESHTLGGARSEAPGGHGPAPKRRHNTSAQRTSTHQSTHRESSETKLASASNRQSKLTRFSQRSVSWLAGHLWQHNLYTSGTTAQSWPTRYVCLCWPATLLRTGVLAEAAAATLRSCEIAIDAGLRQLRYGQCVGIITSGRCARPGPPRRAPTRPRRRLH